MSDLLKSINAFMDYSNSSNHIIQVRNELLDAVLSQDPDICDALTLLRDLKDQNMCDSFIKSLSYSTGIESLLRSKKLSFILSVSNFPFFAKRILDIFQENPHIINPIIDLSIVNIFLKLISEDDLQISEISSKIVTSFIEYLSKIGNISYLEKIVESLQEENSKNGSNLTLSLRYVTILIHIVSIGDIEFDICKRSNALSLIDYLLKCPDELVKIIIMESLFGFANHTSGLVYIFESGVFSWLINLSKFTSNVYSESTNGSPSDPLIRSQALRTVTSIINRADQKQIIIPWDRLENTTTKLFLNYLLNHLESSDSVDRVTGIHALVNFASSGKSLYATVLNDSNLINAWYSNLKSTKSLQAATLISVSMVLSSVNLPSDSRFDDKNNEVGLDEMNKSLLVKMEQILKLPLSEYLLIKIKQPIEETKIAAYTLACSIIRHCSIWGMKTLLSNPKFIVFLEDPSSEFTK